MNAEILNIYMQMMYPKHRENWDIVQEYFKRVFKLPITKKEWQRWRNSIKNEK